MNRIDEMNHNAAMARAERTDEQLRTHRAGTQGIAGTSGSVSRDRVDSSLSPMGHPARPLSKIRPTIDTQELADIVDGLTAHLAYGRLTELEFYRVRDTRDRFANLLSEITPKVTR